MGWFPDSHIASESTYTPANSPGKSVATSEGVPLFSSPSWHNVLAAPGGSNALITGGIYENRAVAMGLLLSLLIFFIISHARSPMRKLPPQPRRIPIIGNLTQMSDKKWLFSRELKEQVGEYWY
jgi:hypothetical protein